MLIIKYRYEFFRYFMYTFALLVSLFIITNITVKEKIIETNDIEKSIIEFNNETSKIYVEYPRFNNKDINNIVTDYIYSYVKDFKSNETTNKVLNVSYQLYYIKDCINISFYIDDSLNKIKTKNILINLNTKDIDYITHIYDEEFLKNHIYDLVYFKYSKDIYDEIINSTLNNYTYILSDSKIEVYFNNIKNDKIDYIPYIEILLDNNVSFEINKKDKSIAFTYDDGPSKYTKDLLKTLELNNSSATFFMIGNRMKKYEDAVLDIYNSNSEIGSHSYAHKDLTKLSSDELKDDLKKTNDIFYSITNDNLKYLRPPYNYINKNVLNSNYKIISWNIDPKDWYVKDSTKIYNHIIKNACDGCIVLMHDIYPTTIEATKILLPKLNELGYQVVSISKLMEEKNYISSKTMTITHIK